jgi:two-component system response regulator FixJ
MQAPPPEPRVYVVDDDPAVRDSVCMLLQTEGLATEAYASGAALLSAASPDMRGCILLDVRLPDMSGLDVQHALAKMAVRLPVIMITAYADVPLAVRAMKAGAIDFIQKPYSDAELLRSIRGALLGADLLVAQDASAADVENHISQLTPREREVLQGLLLGKQNKQIAYDLGISPRTVEIHRARVLEKMQALNLSHLIRMTIAWRPDAG